MFSAAAAVLDALEASVVSLWSEALAWARALKSSTLTWSWAAWAAWAAWAMLTVSLRKVWASVSGTDMVAAGAPRLLRRESGEADSVTRFRF